MNYKEELLNVLCAFNIASVVVHKIVRIRYTLLCIYVRIMPWLIRGTWKYF